MKKTVNIILALVLALTLVLSLTACRAKSDTGSSGDNSISSTTSNIGSKKTIDPPKNQSSHYEYTFSALEGCVIVESDKLSGRCVYKTKCPICGKTSYGTTTVYLSRGTYNSGTTCTNSNCTNWGKNFDVKLEATAQLVYD